MPHIRLSCAVAKTHKSAISKDATGAFYGKYYFVALPGLADTLAYALNAFGFLIRRNESVSPPEFIRRIRDTYDCESCPQNAAVVNALSQLV